MEGYVELSLVEVVKVYPRGGGHADEEPVCGWLGEGHGGGLLYGNSDDGG